MLGLVIVVEVCLASRALDFSSELSWSLSAREVPRQAPGRDVLFLGDSLIKYGMLPRVFEKHSGLTTYNFAAARALAPTTYFLFRRALEAGASPAAVVVDFKPALMGTSADDLIQEAGTMLTVRETTELAIINSALLRAFAPLNQSHREDSLWAQIVLRRLLPSYQLRQGVRLNLLAAFKGEQDALPVLNRTLLRNWSVNDGAHVTPVNPTFTGLFRPEDEQIWKPNHTFLAPVNSHFADRLFALAAARGIRVYWLLPPIAPEFQRCREQSGAEARYLQFVQNAQKLYPNITVLDARHAGFDHTLFYDLSHLSGRGARVLTRAVAATLKRDLNDQARSRPRWIELSRAQSEGDDELIEDILQSRELVLKGAGAPG